MCGLSGYWSAEPNLEVLRDFERLFYQSRIRGLHAFGLVWAREGAQPGVMRSFKAESILEQVDILSAKPPRWMLGHTRYSTSGDWRVLENNQPLVTDAGILVYNGIIHQGTKEEYEAEFGVKCSVDNDGEILLRKVEQGVDPAAFVTGIRGSFAGMYVIGGVPYALRNGRRPLWSSWAKKDGTVYLASTQDIFERAGVGVATGRVEPGRAYKLEDLAP